MILVNIRRIERVIVSVCVLTSLDLDNTADVQFHVWGNTLEEAFEHVALCMFNYITDITTITVDPAVTVVYEVVGHDLESLLYSFMDEMLFRFSTDGFCCAQVKVLDFSRSEYKIRIRA